MPERERLASFAATGATLAIHLSLHNIETVVEDLRPHYGCDCPVAIVFRASWPDETVVRGSLGNIAERAQALTTRRSALILVGPALDPGDFRDSALYDPAHVRRYRGMDGD